MLTSDRLDKVRSLCQSFVQIPSLSGEEKPVLDEVARAMRELGYDVTIDECGNVIGALHGGDGPTLLFDSHVDTVAAADAGAWRFPPHSGAILEDRIWGRGTSDMKGALAASMASLAFAKQDGKLRGTALVSASVGEEIIEGLALTRIIPVYKPDLVVICESTGLKLNTAGRGRAEVTVTVHGKSSHASTPHLGVNAMRQMARLVLAFDTIQPPVDPRIGVGILEPTEVISSPFPSVSVLPWQCRARYDRRLLPGEDESAVLGPINEVMARLSAADPAFKAEATIDTGSFTCYTGLTLSQPKLNPAWALAADDKWVAAAQTALRGVGQPGQIGHYNFCTNGSYTAGRIGVPTLGYGPGFEESAHIRDEYLDLDQLYKAAEGYYALAALAG